MSVNEKMTAIADAIRGKTGKTDVLTLDQMAMEIAGIQIGGGGGGGVEPTASFVAPNEINASIRAYPFKPKYKNSLIVWNVTGAGKPGWGSMTLYALGLFLFNGVPWQNGNLGVQIIGAPYTAPWSDENWEAKARYFPSDTFYFDDAGLLQVQSGTWAAIGDGTNTVTIYEIPLPIGLGV